MSNLTARVEFFGHTGAVALAWLFSATAITTLAQDAAPVFTPLGSITVYGLNWSSPFYSGNERHWLETSLRFGGRIEQGPLTLELGGITVANLGRDPFGSGGAEPDAPPDAPRPGQDPVVDLDTAFVQYSHSGALPLTLTVGRQPIVLGSQFLIGDGVYDGFHTNSRYQQAVYHNPRRNFDGARLEIDSGKLRVDAFAYSVHSTWDGGGDRNGWFGGAEFSWRNEEQHSLWAAGVFRRESHTDLDNDMWVVSTRTEFPLPGSEHWSASGEWLGELGRGYNPAYVTTPDQDLHEYAWHTEIAWQDADQSGKPFAEAGIVYYSKDFTPIATGFSDWGKWYLGNQIDWIIFGTNTKIARVQAGFWPHPQLKARIQYHHTRLVSGPDGPLANEWSLIGEWFVNEQTWVSLLIGYSNPGSALTRSGMVNPFSYVSADAVAVGDKSGIDLVIGFGKTF